MVAAWQTPDDNVKKFISGNVQGGKIYVHLPPD
jgi:hypothetical protein